MRRHISTAPELVRKSLRRLVRVGLEYHEGSFGRGYIWSSLEFEITGGEVNDCTAAAELIDKLPLSEAVVGDKGYDSERVRQQIQSKGSRVVIPRKRNSAEGNGDMDWGLYKYRHLVENAFARLKHYRAIATRYDKLKRNY